MPATTLIEDLTDVALNAWVAAAFDYTDLCYNGDQVLSPDPEDGCAYDTHHYLFDGSPNGRLWTWWLGQAAPGHALRMVTDDDGGLVHEAVLHGMVWRGTTVAEALCRACVGQRFGVHVAALYPWGDELYVTPI